jgi:hypothetical protein
MRQTFIKTVRGHTLEFNRILYPTKYAILSQDVIFAGTVIVVEKDENGAWGINSSSKLPVWVIEIISDIYNVIEENEASKNLDPHSF